jgi:uncharacterized membrane protein YhdT
MSQYGGCIDSPWDEISIRYVMVTSYVARKRPGEAFNEQSQLISCVYLPLDFRTICEDTVQVVLPVFYSKHRVDPARLVLHAA